MGSHGPLLKPGQTTLGVLSPDPDVHPQVGLPALMLPYKAENEGSGTSEDNHDRRNPRLEVRGRWLHVGTLNKWNLGLGCSSADEVFEYLPRMCDALGSIPDTHISQAC